MNDGAGAVVPGGVAAAMARLKARFLERAAGECADLRRWSADLDTAGDLARPVVHRIAGAAGTFGYARLSDLAKLAEDALITGQGRKAALAAVIAELERAIRAPAA